MGRKKNALAERFWDAEDQKCFALIKAVKVEPGVDATGVDGSDGGGDGSGIGNKGVSMAGSDGGGMVSASPDSRGFGWLMQKIK